MLSKTATHRASVPAIPLDRASAGQEVVLAKIGGARVFQHRLAEMGLRPGVHFRVISASRGGPIIISVRHTRLLLGRGTVEQMQVRPA